MGFRIQKDDAGVAFTKITDGQYEGSIKKAGLIGDRSRFKDKS